MLSIAGFLRKSSPFFVHVVYEPHRLGESLGAFALLGKAELDVVCLLVVPLGLEDGLVGRRHGVSFKVKDSVFHNNPSASTDIPWRRYYKKIDKIDKIEKVCINIYFDLDFQDDKRKMKMSH